MTWDWSLILQCVGTALGLLYLWLEYKANIWLWVVGAIMPVVHGVLYFQSGIYADAADKRYPEQTYHNYLYSASCSLSCSLLGCIYTYQTDNKTGQENAYSGKKYSCRKL